MNLIFLGPPGAGKGTIADLAKDALGIPHISTGQLFREQIKIGSPLGKRVEATLKAGDLVDDKTTIAIVRERLARGDVARGYILDGFPRTIAQAEAMCVFSKPEAAINFTLTEEQILRRLEGRRVAPSTGRTYHILYNPPKVAGIDDETGEELIQRPDDKKEAILNRLEVYTRETRPLIDHYRKKNLLLPLDASPTPEEVLKQLLHLLKEKGIH
ncbi:MAG: nucleoside monophosphate kinase [Spirochaetales bacterium]|nr:nucleoside monophosphate kinase [Spirochaetales bacterium]